MANRDIHPCTKRYTTEFKLSVVEETYSRGYGGVIAVAKEKGVSYTTIRLWRKIEDQLRKEVGAAPVSRSKEPVDRHRILSIEEEKQLVSWYKETPGPLSQPVVVQKLRETHPNVFKQSEDDDEASVRRREGNWLYLFLKRNGLTCKGRVASTEGEKL